jgi:hypothetical protein
MLTTEWDWDIAKEVWQEEARREVHVTESIIRRRLKQKFRNKPEHELGYEYLIEYGKELEKFRIVKALIISMSKHQFISGITGVSLDDIKELDPVICY